MRADVFLLKIPEISIESLDESEISRWSLEVLNFNTVLSSFVRNRDPGILSTKVLSTKTTIWIFRDPLSRGPTGVCEKAIVNNNYVFCSSPCPAIQHHKLLSTA